MKINQRWFIRFALGGFAVLLTACGSQSSIQPEAAAAAPAATVAPGVSQAPAAYPAQWVEDAPRVDEQGAVVVEITPLNLNSPGGTLDFSVSLNTHSVDLSMDLTALATLTTDTGHTVEAVAWDAPSGGHHVRGVLSFPSGVDGEPLLKDVSRITITVVNLDVPERVFVWER